MGKSFDPDAYLAQKSSGFDPDAYLAHAQAVPEQTFGDSLKSLYKSGKETLADTITGAQSAIPFSGLVDKAGAASYAAQQEIGDLFRDPEKQDTFKHRYDAVLDSIDRERRNAEQRSPIANTAGKVLGAGTGLAVPIPGAGMGGVAGAATRVLGGMGMSALDEGTKGRELFDPDAALQAATTAGLIGGGVETALGVGKLGAKGFNWAADKLKGAGEGLSAKAEEKAFKAAVGNQAKAYNEAADAGVINDRGRELLDSGVVGFGDSAQQIADKAKGEKSKAWGAMKDIMQGIDERAGNSVDGRVIAAELRDQANKLSGEGDKALAAALRDSADHYEQMGEMSLGQAQVEKNSHKFKPGQDFALPNIKKSAVSKEMERAIGRAGAGEFSKEAENLSEMAATGTGPVSRQSYPTGPMDAVSKEASAIEDELPGLAQEYKDAKSKYGTMAAAMKDAQVNANRYNKNNSFSLGDKAAAMAAGALAHGNPVVKAAFGALAGAGNKLVRKRGASALAVSLDKAGQLLQSAPEALGKYGPVLENAAKRGNAAFTATHYMLMNSDPDYRKAMEGDDGSN